ncbi:epoxyqueuosine reductase [Orenia metallireducens]|jgi:epoxyqueuosine reductase|uniref:Epoxyqueuosine reductase n=1 Tax=Orenia metallireducens TaxID=1413210 RepID=A0A285FX24_9FIRM|nr:tRNA epoxyqueuosine(34) reductase QueG [Orenia metallireducens]PRX35584.1 epoxyqueuosine reductase [Orenia metallireducens]SNY15910.1 epoxyqueuosine reductase [Orenia metallireducens]
MIITLTTEIKSYAKSIGIDDIKITNAESFPELKEFLIEMREKEYLSTLVHDDLEKISNPKEIVLEAKSVIVCAISYSVDDKYIFESRIRAKEELRGSLSRFAWGQDYHRVLGDRLDKLIEFIKTKKQRIEAFKFVDTGPTVDRALARRAGIGWQGKNCSIINPEYGSWIFLGGVITDLELEYDSPIEDKCGDCRRCIDACPTGALVDAYTLDSRKCLGYITLSKGYLDEKQRKKMGTRLWGCDTCQSVCPQNQGAKLGDHEEFSPQTLEAYPDLISLLTLSNKEYKDKFMITPMNWRGKRPIQRNAAIILGNLKDRRAVPYLLDALSDPKPIVRANVAWALGEIGDESALDRLEKALLKEKDKQVIEELEKATERLGIVGQESENS